VNLPPNAQSLHGLWAGHLLNSKSGASKASATEFAMSSRTKMSATEFLQLPKGVIVLVVVMLWPAIWAGALMIVALAGDLRRQTEGRMPARRRVA